MQYKNKLVLKLIAYILLSSLIITLMVTGIQLYLTYKDEIASIENRSEQIEKSYLPSLAKQLWVGDFDIMKVQFKGISRLPYVQFVQISAKDLPEPVVLGKRKTDNIIEYTYQVEYEFKKKKYNLGVFYIQFDLNAVYGKLSRELFMIFKIQTAIIFLVSILIFIIFRQLIMRHLYTIAAYVRKLHIDNLTDTLKLDRKPQEKDPDELEEVVNGLNEMRINLLNETRKITNLNDAFVKFVPQDFLTHLNKKSITEVNLGDSTQRKMSVLFTDIRSFTLISEKMSLEENFEFLNDYLGKLVPAIRDNNGFIDKYIGDAIMALFDRQADDAILSGIKMLEELRKFNQKRAAEGKEEVQMGIGIHTGNLMLGTVGEESRMQTTVISDAVNVASRIEGMTKMYSTPLLISDEVLNSIENLEKFSIRFIDKVVPSGKNVPIKIYEVYNADESDIFNKKSTIHEDFEKAALLYFSKELNSAVKLFEKCLEIFPEDKATKIYIQRCNHWMKNDLDENWNGITQLDSK